MAFMSADGTLLPCCFLNVAHIRANLQQWLEERGGSMDDFTYDADQEIVTKRKSWQLLTDTFDSYDSAFSECQRICGSSDLISNDGGSMHNIVST